MPHHFADAVDVHGAVLALVIAHGNDHAEGDEQHGKDIDPQRGVRTFGVIFHGEQDPHGDRCKKRFDPENRIFILHGGAKPPPGSHSVSAGASIC